MSYWQTAWQMDRTDCLNAWQTDRTDLLTTWEMDQLIVWLTGLLSY